MSTKVAIIIEDFSTWGGVEIVTNHLLNTDLPIWGIIGLRQSKEVPTIPYPRHIELHTQNDTDKIIQLLKNNNITHIIIQIFDIKKSYELITKLKKYNIKSIFFFHSTPYCFYSISNHVHHKGIRTKLKEFINTKIFPTPQYQEYKDDLEKLIFYSDHFLVLSENIVNEFKNIVNKKYHKNIKFIYNLIPQEKIKNIPFPNKENSIVFAGRLTGPKGIFLTVKTLIPLLKKYTNWNFYILGNGYEYERLQNLIMESNSKNIHLIGKVNNVYSYLEKSKICILYSLFEGLPTILLEAGYFNNVLISYNSKGGVSDIIENKRNGFIVNHTKELYEKVEYLINNPDKIEEMALNNNIVFEKFDNEKTISKWKSILK